MGRDRDRGERGERGERSERGERGGGRRGRRKNNDCHFVDYKDTGSLRRTMSAQGKLHSRKRGQNCAKCQRLVAQAVKRARFMGILSYTN
jgi:small subunit ribosomal protein S18